MSTSIKIEPVQQEDFHNLSIMVGELLGEIMNKTNNKTFNYNQLETEVRAKSLVSKGKYWVFIVKDTDIDTSVGFVSLYESYALYSEGVFGTIPELYIRPKWRSKSIGKQLLTKVNKFAANKGWNRIELTTPPLPEFERTLNFYQSNGFEISGGRKMKMDVAGK